jgi:CheY-like chemotaxis protein
MSSGQGRKPHLLVADDYEAFRELTAVRLRALGCTCTAVASVPAAIEALEREQFDAVLSDYSMPRLSGLDLLAYVRRRWPELPFWIMGSFIEDNVRREALARGASGVYEKSELVDSLAPVIPRPHQFAA